MPKRGFNGRSPNQPAASSKNWMPEVLFQPQEPGARNKANCKPIEPTSWYAQDDAPVFRPFGTNDEG